MAVVLFNKTLTGAFVATQPIMLSAEELTLYFQLTTSGGPTKVEWYPEFNDDLDVWYREIAEEDGGKGVILMPKTIRTFADNNGTQLADGTHNLIAPLVRQSAFARIQMRVTAGAATALVTSNSGTVPQPA